MVRWAMQANEVRPRLTCNVNVEPHDGKLTAVRLGCQLTLVHENQHHPLPEQGGHLQAETGPLTSIQLLPRLHWRYRRQQGSQVPAMAV